MRRGPVLRSNGLLVLYHRPTVRRDAATVRESIEAFARHLKFKVWSINTEWGFPDGLEEVHFQAIVLHYSLFFGRNYMLNSRFCEYLDRCDWNYKVAFFQDEHRYCRKRFGFLNRYRVDCVYTLTSPEYFDATYRKYTCVPKLVHYVPGYVSEDLIEAARVFGRPDKERAIDIGYRGRPLEFYMGRGAQEKQAIATGFLSRAAGLNLRLDIECNERKRLYGNAWYRFAASCRGFLGVEAGVSVFDVDDLVQTEVERLIAVKPGISFQEVYERVLHAWEDRIPYRTISPRHFEAAAFRVCQILFEGNYSSILQPGMHYIALKKDFSNFDEVIRLFRDADVRRELTERAYRDLIASGRYSYQRFIEDFDAQLMAVGLKPGSAGDEDRVKALLQSGALYRKARAAVVGLRFYGDAVPVSVRRLLRPITRRLLYDVASDRQEGSEDF